MRRVARSFFTEAVKEKPLGWKPEGERAQRFLRRWLVLVIVNVMFQGIRAADPRERAWRLVTELIADLSLTLWRPHRRTLTRWLVHAATVHLACWAVHGNPWVVLRYAPWYSRNHLRVSAIAVQIVRLVEKQEWIDEAVVIGSAARSRLRLSERSDLDLRIILPSSISGCLCGLVFIARLRVLCLLKGFPLDVYGYDSVEALLRFDQSEPILLVRDVNGRVSAASAGRAVVR